MKKELLEALKKNAYTTSNIPQTTINEETNSSDLNTNFDYLINNLIEMTVPKTISSSVCSVQPLLHGPGGKAYGVKRSVDPITSEIKISVDSSNVIANFSKRFKSDFTGEVMDEYNNVFNKIERDIFIQAASAESSSYVDSIILPVLRNLATPMAPSVLDGNPETAYYQMLHNIHLALVDINRTTKRGLRGYAILSPTLAGLFCQFNDIYNDSNNVDTSRSARDIYFLGGTDQVDYYIDPMAPQDDVVVGYRSEIEGETAVIYCPYTFTVYKTDGVEDGNGLYYSLTRFGYIRNPLDNGSSNHDSDFLRIFALDASAVGDTSGAGAGTTLNSGVNNYQRDDSVAGAGDTTITSTGTGLVPRLFIDGVYIDNSEYSWTSPNVTLNSALVGGEKISLETFDIV